MGIRIPGFKLVTDTDEANSLGELSADLTIGFGLHWAWVYASMFATVRIFLADTNQASLVANYFYLISMVSLVATLLLSGFLFEKLSPYLRKTPTPFFAASFSTLGTAALPLANIDTFIGMVFLAIASVFTGLGSGILLVAWGESFSRNDTQTNVLNSALGIIIAFVVYIIVLAYLPRILSIAVIIVMPLIEAYLIRRILASKISADLPRFAKLRVRKGSFALHIGLSSIIFGFALGTVRQLSVGTAFQSADTTSQLILLAGAIFAAPLLICTVLLLSGYEFGFLYRPLVPFIAVALLLIPFIGSNGDGVILTLILLVGYVSFEVMMWVAFAEISYRFRLSSVLVFGLGRAFLTAGTLIGAIGSSMLASIDGLFSINSTGGSLLAMFALVLAYALLPREKDIKDMVLLDEIDDVAGAVVDDENAQRNHRFTKKCEKVATHYLLSKRETEVLYLLAKGRNASYIKDALYISEGTAKTHIWRIYKKLNVHTQQDLIELIDQS